MRPRGGFSAILLVLGAAFLLLVWGSAQQFVSATVARRVRIAQAERRCLMVTTQAVEEGVELFQRLSNRDLDPGADSGARSLAGELRALRPGQVLEFSYVPELSHAAASGPDGVDLEAVLVRAWIQDVRPPRGRRPPGFDCAAWGALLREEAARDLAPFDVVRRENELYGDWRPPGVAGILELRATAHATVSRVRVSRRVTVRRQFDADVAPCPEELVAALGTGLASVVRVNPVELGRFVERYRQGVVLDGGGAR